MPDLKLIKKTDTRVDFLLQNSIPSYSNALRRIMMNEVPVLAVENVEFRKNSSALYDEVIAHRLGLLPLTTDLKTYEMPKSEDDIKEKNAKCTVQLTLKEKGPKTVYAEDLKTADPKVKPVHPKMPIVKLLKDQEIELIAVAVVGQGNQHVKWSPAHVWFSNNPTIKVGKTAEVEKYRELYPPEIFDKNGKIDENVIIKNNLVDAVAHINDDIIKVEYSDKDYVFSIEPWGQLSSDEIFEEALNILDKKLNELDKLL